MFNFLKRMKINSIKRKLNGLAKARQLSPVSDEEIKKEIQILYQLAKFYEKLQYNKKFPHSEQLARECYRTAASLDDREAAYIVAEQFMELGKFWDEVKKDEFWLSKSHDKYREDAYHEAFAYLKVAEDKGHPLAKRLHGVAYINGWGVTPDMDHGFKLVIASIEQQNAWDKATDILKELGLNKPEFFSYVISSKERAAK